MALLRPKLTVVLLSGGAAGTLLISPLLGWLAGFAPAALREALPLSWEWRLVLWRYVSEHIAQKPIFGWGLDAARTFNEEMTLRGQGGLDIVPLHAHSAGLQIWLETGFIGAFLAAGALILAGRSIINAPQLDRLQTAALAGGFAAIAAISSISYGVWQEWWWACSFLTATAVILTRPKA